MYCIYCISCWNICDDWFFVDEVFDTVEECEENIIERLEDCDEDEDYKYTIYKIKTEKIVKRKPIKHELIEI